MTRTSVAGFPDDWGKWLTLASALVGVGVLPKAWQKTISAASAAIVIIKMLD